MTAELVKLELGMHASATLAGEAAFQAAANTTGYLATPTTNGSDDVLRSVGLPVSAFDEGDLDSEPGHKERFDALLKRAVKPKR